MKPGRSCYPVLNTVSRAKGCASAGPLRRSDLNGAKGSGVALECRQDVAGVA
jgi:hypothetical protein